MTSSAFARARTEEQRAARREAILSAAADLLEGSRVAELSLNELARHVGLAKSNVLRYFESREAVLLELLDREQRAWLDDVEARLDAVGEPVAAVDEVERVAAAIADAAAAHPLLGELTANSTTVLEHNVSAGVAATYKRASIANARRLSALAGTRVGGFTEEAALSFAGAVMLAVGGVWAMCRPSAGMLAAYREQPDLEAYRLDYHGVLGELVATVLTGLLHRPARAPAPPGA